MRSKQKGHAGQRKNLAIESRDQNSTITNYLQPAGRQTCWRTIRFCACRHDLNNECRRHTARAFMSTVLGIRILFAAVTSTSRYYMMAYSRLSTSLPPSIRSTSLGLRRWSAAVLLICIVIASRQLTNFSITQRHIVMSTKMHWQCILYRVGQKTGLFFESLKLPYMLT